MGPGGGDFIKFYLKGIFFWSFCIIYSSMATLLMATIINSGDCLVRNCVCIASLPLKCEQIYLLLWITILLYLFCIYYYVLTILPPYREKIRRGISQDLPEPPPTTTYLGEFWPHGSDQRWATNRYDTRKCTIKATPIHRLFREKSNKALQSVQHVNTSTLPFSSTNSPSNPRPPLPHS